MKRPAIALVAFWMLVLGTSPSAGAVATDDAYAAGYAAAVLEREFPVAAPSLRVRDGVLTVAASDLAGGA